MKEFIRFSRIAGLVLAVLLFRGSPSLGQGPAGTDAIVSLRISGVINPVVADFLTSQIEKANIRDDRAILVELDTPGGLDTSMRAIIQGILGSKIPVIVYVYPSGARAASAGALITLSADFAAMAPGTNIGAAHPVTIGFGGGGEEKGSTMMEKVLNDAAAYARSIAQERGRNVEWAERIVRKSISTSATEALKLKVIDVVAPDVKALLKDLDGRRYQRNGETLTLSTADARIVPVEMGWRQKILNTLSNPNVAYMLLMLGILGIFFEISQPGVILPGAIGAISILLALFAFQTLPINYVGVLFILLAVVLFVLEVKVASYGMLTIGGIISLTIGSLMLIESSKPFLQISRAIIGATVAVASGFIILVLYFMVRTQKSRFVSGAEGLAGEVGEAVTDIHAQGRVFVHGEYWDAYSSDTIEKGEKVRVLGIREGFRLEVEKSKIETQDSRLKAED
jgi:membrane-bound serine protease (ClpP class)